MATAAMLNMNSAFADAKAMKAAAPMAAADTGNNSSTNTSGDSSTISANDFLTLLVTEMKNQDPTANTDPNEYINQLVQVNSLQQLIGINQTLTGALGTPTPSTNSPSKDGAHNLGGPIASNPLASLSADAQNVAGNLTIPPVNPAAQSIAHALTAGTVSLAR